MQEWVRNFGLGPLWVTARHLDSQDPLRDNWWQHGVRLVRDSLHDSFGLLPLLVGAVVSYVASVQVSDSTSIQAPAAVGLFVLSTWILMVLAAAGVGVATSHARLRDRAVQAAVEEGWASTGAEAERCRQERESWAALLWLQRSLAQAQATLPQLIELADTNYDAEHPPPVPPDHVMQAVRKLGGFYVSVKDVLLNLGRKDLADGLGSLPGPDATQDGLRQQYYTILRCVQRVAWAGSELFPELEAPRDYSNKYWL